jgi:hypothetical protein
VTVSPVIMKEKDPSTLVLHNSFDLLEENSELPSREAKLPDMAVAISSKDMLLGSAGHDMHARSFPRVVSVSSGQTWDHNNAMQCDSVELLTTKLVESVCASAEMPITDKLVEPVTVTEVLGPDKGKIQNANSFKHCSEASKKE